MQPKSPSQAPLTPAEKARIKAGLSKEEAAKRARIGVPYLRRIELHGGASYVLAVRLAHIYQCDIMVFLYNSHQGRSGRT